MSNPVRILTARSGVDHISHPDRPDYFLCGAGGKYGAPVTSSSRPSTDEEFRRMVLGCKSCKRGLDRMNMDAVVKLVNAGPVADKPAGIAPAVVEPVTATPRTATVVAHPVTLHARVRVLRRTGDRYEVAVISGVGGWSTPGKRFFADADTVRFDDAGEVAPVETAEPTPITEPMDAEDYMTLLAARQEQWKRATQARTGLAPRLLPLLEWFILPGEEALVRLPESKPAPRKARTPRVYRSAASLREERDELVTRMAHLAGTDDVPDRAAANLSPNSRSKAARRAGVRRFAKMDRDLGEYAALQRRVNGLNGQIARAEARERV